jgi:hypothetical protein
MKGCALFVTALLSAGAGSAFAQTADERIERGLAHAREVGVPVELLESKIAEGKAKGIPMDRIAAAVEHRLAVLERAGGALRGQPGVGPADLTVAADALESGVSEKVLRTLAETAPRERRVVAIATLDQLARRGVPVDKALERVRDALRRGPEALLNLPAQAGEDGSPRRPGPGPGPGGDVRPAEGGHSGPPLNAPPPGGGGEPVRPSNGGSGTPGADGRRGRK